MADFNSTRQQLRQARADKEQAADSVVRAKEQIKHIDAQAAQLNRNFNPNDPAHVTQRDKLTQQRAAAQGKLQDGKQNLGLADQALAAKLAAFEVFSDPRTEVSQLSDAFPFLLFPVRLETRFKNATVGGQPKPQLWVRIYPDTCSIDTFEPTLSDTEVQNARAYWIGIWKSAGIEEQDRGAWRGLVASHGPGRAAWIVKNYQPLNLAAKPVKANASDLVLTIAGETALTDPELTATAAYWPAFWTAYGDPAAEQAARAALDGAVGAARAAEIVVQYRPVGFDPPAGFTSDEVANVTAALVLFPKADDVDTKTQSWSRAPRVAAMPDRFVFIGYPASGAPVVAIGKAVASPLTAGPDPSADAADQLRQEAGNIVVPDAMKWMVDFDRAVDQGMGLRIDLNAAQARAGFKRVLVLGVRLSADETAAKAELETLLAHHQYGLNGLSLIPQGTPTNNTESGDSGYSRDDDADASFDDLFKSDKLFEPSSDWLLKRDGQWLAECLGIDGGVLEKVRHSGGTDQSEARAMNIALWPATFGYWMESMLHPIFAAGRKDGEGGGNAAIDDTRRFFVEFVSGRGWVPALRIGNQPYGILPTTAFSRMTWLNPPQAPGSSTMPPDPFKAYLRALAFLLKTMDADWQTMAQQVSYAGKPSGDAHQVLLDILGLHSGSVEYAQRYAESAQQLFNEFNFWGLGPSFAAAFASLLDQDALALVQKFGVKNIRPDILDKYFFGKHNPLKGPLIDDRPFSESEPVRPYTPLGKNYLEWLIETSSTSLDGLRLQNGFTDNKPPTALLYLMLRHAIQLGAYDASLRLHDEHNLLPLAAAMEARREPPFIHVKQAAPASESRYALLYKTVPAITGNPSMLLGDYIATSFKTLLSARYLADQLRALEQLKQVPTARLERVFAEHIDCCSYRLDTWMQGIVHSQLAKMRNLEPGGNAAAHAGIHLGAYAWLENLAPDNKVFSAVTLSPELDAYFNRPGEPKVARDSTNQGYIHAPSLNQAVTGAVLRNGYMSAASPANRQTMAVNLTSERVRRALGMLEGIRGGQSLGALLGYQFERGLHDDHNLAEVDKFIYDLRKAFPLRANRLSSTFVEGVSIEAIEARNVMDGLRFVTHVKETGNASYPFGKVLEPATAAERAAIDLEADRLLQAYDAVADLALAEGVHQAVLGNYDRVASTLDSYSKGHFPPEPEVVRTPQNGTALTHRIALHLESAVDPTLSPVAGVAMSPRATAEPAVNKWLAGLIPPFDQIGCKAGFRDAATNAGTVVDVTLQDLGLQPIDLLYMVPAEVRQEMTELDDRILRHVIGNNAVRPVDDVDIRYMEGPGGGISLFEVMPLIRALRRLVMLSRPLRPTDLSLANDASSGGDDAVFSDKQRVTLAQTALQTLRNDLAAFQAVLNAPLADPIANRAQILTDADAWLDTIVTLLARAAQFEIPHTGWGFAFDWRRRQFVTTLAKIATRADRWAQNLMRFDGVIAEYDALPVATADPNKFALLRLAELEVSTVQINAPPASPDGFKTILLGLRAIFAARRTAFMNILATQRTTVALLSGDVAALLPVSDIDLEPLDFADEEQQTILFATDALTLVTSVIAECDSRLASATASVAAYDAATTAPARVKAFQTAAKALLGEHFVTIPEFSLTLDQGDELEKAFAAGQDGTLTQYLTGTAQIDFPVDEWFAGVARVRERAHTLEQVVMLSGAFGRPEPALAPAQLPYRDDDRWLALQFPPDYAFDGERLLYTATFAAPFNKAARQCGILLDEWPEVLPARNADTGIAFHYDRPNNEAPQTMLLVTPTDFRGGWQWADLVDALNETLDRAKRRAVEPAQVDATTYARFLPATVTAVTLSGLTISMNLAANNRFETFLKET